MTTTMDPAKLGQGDMEAIEEGLDLVNDNPQYKKRGQIIKERYEERTGWKCPKNLLAAAGNCFETYKQFTEGITDEFRQFLPEDIYEQTQSTDVDHFTRQGLDVNTTILPNLIATEVVNVFPLNRPVAQAFFFDLVAGSSSGSEVGEGEALASPETGVKGTENFTSPVQDDEVLIDSADSRVDGNTASFSDGTRFGEIIPGSVTIEATASDGEVMKAEDDGSQGLIDADPNDTDLDSGGTNTIDYGSGAVDVTFDKNVADDSDIVITYKVDFEKNFDAIANFKAELRSEFLRAKTRKMKFEYMQDAAFNFEETHDRDLGDDIQDHSTRYMRWEIDVEILNDLLMLGGDPSDFVFDAENSPEVTLNDHNEDIKNLLLAMGGEIFDRTTQGFGNFVVGGIDFATLMMGLDGFNAETDLTNLANSGPQRIGNFENMFTIYVNPFYPRDEFVMGMRGQDFRMAGYLYAPFIPAFITPRLLRANMKNEQGAMTSYAKKAINPNFYQAGKLVNTGKPFQIG